MDFWRQLDIVSPDDFKPHKITVIGAGGIGSPTILALSKVGVQHLTVYDYDTIEAHNLPNQFYRLSDVNKLKVDAIADISQQYGGITIEKKPEPYKGQPLSGIVISGVDSMDVRKLIWDRIKYNPNISNYIEARMGAEVARIYTVIPCDPTDVTWYETMLYTDDKAMELPCTQRAIIYCVLMIAALISNQVKKIAKMEEIKKEIICDLKTLNLITS